MLTKDKLLESIKSMPEDSFDDLAVLTERIFMINKVEQAEDDIKQGRVYTNEQMKEIIASWFPSSGQKQQIAI